MIQNHKELIVWQKAVNLATKIYHLTKQLPKTEIFNLCSQMQRSAVSIASNIAEGRSRGTRNDFAQFLHIALGSCVELETQIIILKTLPFGANLHYNDIEELIGDITRMLRAMIVKLKSTKH